MRRGRGRRKGLVGRDALVLAAVVVVDDGVSGPHFGFLGDERGHGHGRAVGDARDCRGSARAQSNQWGLWDLRRTRRGRGGCVWLRLNAVLARGWRIVVHMTIER